MPTEGYLALVLHTHLPYLINHGVWPHGLDWLHEATAETYVPLLGALKDLEERGLQARFSINLTPVLLEQLEHPSFEAEFPKYLDAKIEAARKDQAEFQANGDGIYLDQARYWEQHYLEVERLFTDVFGYDIVTAMAHFAERGQLEIMTCAATHGYFPLLGTDASIYAQVKLATETHQRLFSRRPRGIWLPECGYRPAGAWTPPAVGLSERPSMRAGVEEILAANGIEYFIVDTHLVERSYRFSPYERHRGHLAQQLGPSGRPLAKTFYAPHYVTSNGTTPVAFYTRDPRTGLQVWSGESGYPGDANYLDFHKKRWPTGLRYWQVTQANLDLGAKTPYSRERASARTRENARHFAQMVTGILGEEFRRRGEPGILVAPFDAELFGHWWYEGVEWLGHVVEELARPESPVRLITLGSYLDKYPPQASLALPEGSWGRGGFHEMWLNPDTEWTWREIYAAEKAVLDILADPTYRSNPLGLRVVKQLCRELLLLESSDWQFLISTGHARDYAEMRFRRHAGWFAELKELYDEVRATGDLRPGRKVRLEEIEQADSIFSWLDPEIYRQQVTRPASSSAR